MSLAFACSPRRVARAQELPSQPITLPGGHVVIGADVSFSTSPQDDGKPPSRLVQLHRLRAQHDAADARGRHRQHPHQRSSVVSRRDCAARTATAAALRALYVRVRPLDAERAIDIQAGRIPPTFGAFSRRVYGDGNPLIGYPLAYQYLTSLRPDAVPADADELLRMRARGWRPFYRIGNQTIATGMPLMTAFRWDTGVQVHVGPERLLGERRRSPTAPSRIRAPRTTTAASRFPGALQWHAGHRPRAWRVRGARTAIWPTDVAELASGARGIRRTSAPWSRRGILTRSLAGARRRRLESLGHADAGAVARRRQRIRRRHLQDPPGLFVAARVDRLTFSKVAGTDADAHLGRAR